LDFHHPMSNVDDNIATARRYLSAIESGGDFASVSDYYAPDVIQVEYPNRLVPEGAQRDLDVLIEAWQRGQNVVASQRYEVRNVVASGDWVALEVTWSAVLNVAVGTIPASGEMRAQFAVFLQFRDGKIVRQHNYDCFDAF
jgi:ketosteroid isomerase-like protein